MKKIFLVTFMIVSLLLMSACGKNGIVGKWTYQSGSYSYVFEKDGTGYYEYGSNKKEFTYKVDGEKITILYNGNTIPFETVFTIDDNKLIIKDSYENDTVYIRQ